MMVLPLLLPPFNVAAVAQARDRRTGDIVVRALSVSANLCVVYLTRLGIILLPFCDDRAHGPVTVKCFTNGDQAC
jgi:hypothetical protein